jgi:transposase
MKDLETLKNYEWLKNEYLTKNKSQREIAKQLNCGATTVGRAIKKFNLKKKDSNTESKYKELNDEKWVYQKYVVEKLGTNKIMEIIGARHPNSVRQALNRFGIPVRSISEGLTCKRNNDGLILNEKTLEIINGCLLGDGSMIKWNPESDNSNPYFKKRNKYYDHVSYVASEIGGINVEESNEKCSWDKTKPYTVFSLRTKSHKELLPLYKEWYPESNNFKKVVPRSLYLTPIMLLHWFMDDGSSYLRKRKYKNNRQGSIKRQKHDQVQICFCCESFSKEDQEFLVQKMSNNFGIESTIRNYKDGTGWRIHIRQSYAQRFYEIIGPCPVPSMQYKWKLNA